MSDIVDPAQLIAAAQGLLADLARREAGIALLRFESVDDLVLGMQQAALQSLPSLVWSGDAAFRGWLVQIARRHLSARRDHWFALKRHGGAILRLTLSGGDAPTNVGPGPRTLAQRREELASITKAMALLPERDRELILWTSEGASFDEQARRLGVEPDAARKAASRAMERLRKTLRILTMPSE